jgi:hypothetical protein
VSTPESEGRLCDKTCRYHLWVTDGGGPYEPYESYEVCEILGSFEYEDCPDDTPRRCDVTTEFIRGFILWGLPELRLRGAPLGAGVTFTFPGREAFDDNLART